MTIDEFLDSTDLWLDAEAEFGEYERRALRQAMETCGLTEYPPVAGYQTVETASSLTVCQVCGNDYGAHPMDWRVIGPCGLPYLNVLCDGRRVKL